MKALIFGINSQDGFYLNEILKNSSVEVVGISRSAGSWLKGDVSDTDFVEGLIKSKNPDYIFHLAANSTTQHYTLFENHETISTGTLNILESVYKYSPKTKVFLSGSAMQFENKGLPIDENHFAPLRKIVGITAKDSTLFIVVGQPYKPTPAGKGGFNLGIPFRPERLSSKAVSSPQI